MRDSSSITPRDDLVKLIQSAHIRLICEGPSHWIDQPAALGSAVLAATALGVYESVDQAIEGMRQTISDEFVMLNKAREDIYEKRYRRYLRIAAFEESGY